MPLQYDLHGRLAVFLSKLCKYRLGKQILITMTYRVEGLHADIMLIKKSAKLPLLKIRMSFDLIHLRNNVAFLQYILYPCLILILHEACICLS